MNIALTISQNKRTKIILLSLELIKGTQPIDQSKHSHSGHISNHIFKQ